MESPNFLSQIVAISRDHERELGLPQGFLDALLQADDWSFIIKLHALLEASMTHALVVHSGLESARAIFAQLEMSNNRIGKLAFSKALSFLESEDRRFIKSLSELRNELVHEIRNVSFSLDAHLAQMGVAQRRTFARDFGYADAEEAPTVDEQDRYAERFAKDAKKIVWKSAIFVIAVLQLRIDTKRLRRKAEEDQIRFAELVGSSLAAGNEVDAGIKRRT